MPEWKTHIYSKAEELPNMLAEVQSLSKKITAALTKKDEAIQLQKDNRTLLDNFLNDNPAISEPRLAELLKLKNEIGSQRQFADNTKKEIASAIGALESINGQIEKHQENKPEFADGETLDSLQTTINNLKIQIEPLGKESGAIGQQLEDDDALKEKIVALKKDYEQKKAVFERWNRLDKLIGDAKGDKFRLIAQSYILANLVNAANVHMRTLTDRYTLHAVPGQELIILVEDAYQGGVKRPASTISGGESFLVSLALALALSEIGQSLKVETLFIDEGFGTLSGEPLSKAIDTLGSLHETNNRQVCAISHREEVKEKIPVQIQVNQNKQSSSSTIEVVLKL